MKAKKRKIFEQDEVEENEEDETKTQLPDAKFNGPSLRRRVMEEDKRAKEVKNWNIHKVYLLYPLI